MRAVFALLLILLAAPLAAEEGRDGAPEIFDLRRFTCPVGGESFAHDVGYLSFPLTTLPDGSWLGDVLIDAQIPECPGNGLVILPDYAAMDDSGEQRMLYGEYSEAELARLPALIADPEYVALKAEGRHAQGYWLATRLERPARDRFHLLQRATWAARTPELRHKLVARLVEQGPALIAAGATTGHPARAAGFYIVNGLRELGRFDEALALLGELEGNSEAVPVQADPHETIAGYSAAQMRLAIAERDDGRFPVELLDQRMVGPICDGGLVAPYDERTAGTVAACEVRRGREAREAAEEEAALAEADVLREDLPALERQCRETAPEARKRGLEEACLGIEWQHDKHAADALLLDHAQQVAEDCERVPRHAREQTLSLACTSYEGAVEAAAADLLAGDDAAYAVVCFEGGKGDHSGDLTEIQSVCSSAQQRRDSRAEVILLADLPGLDARCAATAEDDRESALRHACFMRGLDLDRAERQRLLADPAAFERRCGGAREADYDTMSEDELEEANFCSTLRELQQANPDEAAGISCYEELDAPDGEPIDVEFGCLPEAEAESAPENEPDAHDPDDETSELSQIARAKAARLVAAAMADANGGQ